MKQIDEAAQSCLTSNTKIIYNTEKLIDPRSYKVSFLRAKAELGFSAETNLISGGDDILNHVKSMAAHEDILGRKTNAWAKFKGCSSRGGR